MRALLVGIVLLVLAALVVAFVEPLAPTAQVEGLGAALGRGTPLRVTASDRGSGLARVEVRLVPGDGSEPLVLARQEFPRTGILGSGVHEATLTPTLGANVPVPEGKATLEVYASDHSLLSALRRGPRVAQPVMVDVTPPQLTVVSKNHSARLGGSELAVFHVGSDTASAGVQVGDLFFPASAGVFKEPELRAVLFAIPDDSTNAKPVAVAIDAAGNRAEAPLDVHIPPRKFADKKLAITDAFLQRKVPELLAAAGRVIFVGPLGIYGNAVIIDHGLGLYTLYGHLSEAVATTGAEVARGDTIGKTGDSGLAGGDHLHFSTMIGGIHVDPADWWDKHWIGDHLFGRLADHPRPPPPAPAPPPESTP